ncbi:MAG TPA: cytochrome C oxidase subunit IV family protein [Sinorhizobium sp.]|nr:cytochrome C oxidase subunit IV family protein [Sinorhizobium sp.]
MSGNAPKQLRKTWLWLVAMVVAGILLVHEASDPALSLALTASLLLLAVLKARLVVLDFLALRSGPRPLRIGLLAWPAFFAFAAAAKALIAAFPAGG